MSAENRTFIDLSESVSPSPEFLRFLDVKPAAGMTEKISQDTLIEYLEIAKKKAEEDNPWLYVSIEEIPEENHIEVTATVDAETEDESTSESTSDAPEKQPRVLMWKFFRDLLKDKNTNPSLVRWLDEKELVFKIEKSVEVAHMWGNHKRQKNAKKMTYDTMSRGMRDGISREFFSKPDFKKYKCHFVKQFGKRSYSKCSWLRSLKSNKDKSEQN